MHRFRSTSRGLLTGICIVAAGGAAYAHHSYVTKYDSQKLIRLTGTVSSVSYANPHIFFTLDTGKGDWRIETESLAVARARGLTQSVLKEGAKVTLTGWPDRDGSAALGLKSVNFQGGPSITMRSTAR